RRGWGPGALIDDKGQTTLFVLSSFWVFFMLFALVANVGQAVNRRVMLQMVADAGAFSGASAQATVMNTISEFNQIIDTSWDITQAVMLYFTFQFCGVDDVVTTAYKIIEGVLSVMIRVANHGGAVWSIMEAEMVTRQNIRHLFPDGSVHSPLDSFGSLLSSPASAGMGVSHIANMQKAWPALFSGFAVVRLEQESVTKNWICYTPPFSISSKSGSFNLPWEKTDPDEVTRFYWWVTADPVDALVLPRKSWMPFGFPQVPAMTAVALAKPVGGDVEPDDRGDEYVAKLIPLSTISATFFDLSGSLPSLTEVLH
ncbi:MAG: Tad domain-containing protein, partial [Vicinamibacteria bacterium]